MKEFNDHIETALRKEVEFRLPENFSTKVMNLIIAREKKERKWEIAGIVAAILFLISALGVTLYFTEFKFSLRGLTFLSDHLGLVGFAVVFIALLNIVDKKIIRKQQPA